MTNICYVSAFYDLSRENWKYFNRTFEDYLTCFQPYIDMFCKEDTKGCEMVVYIDVNRSEQFKKAIPKNCKMKVIDIDKVFMNNLHIWRKLSREREIMNSESFRLLIPHRLYFPEHTIPEYTLINHSKIDFVNYTIDNVCDVEYYSWVDFGYFKLPNYIPTNFLDVNKFDTSRINYTLINQLTEHDKSIMYTLTNAPERIGGFFFFGSKECMKQYQQLYHNVLEYFQNTLNIADDDQALALACYYTNKDLFKLHMLGEWHKALIHFQINT